MTRIGLRIFKAALATVLLSGPSALAQVIADASGPGSITSDQPITPIPPAPATNRQKTALGRSLFFDPKLSGDGKRACSSCHEIGTNGADGERFDLDPKGKFNNVNTNTVFNAALSFRINWEGNAKTLEDAAAMSFNNPGLMGSSVAFAVSAVRSDHHLAQQFERIYGHKPDRQSLLDAISTYERSLVTPDSRFDLWLKGDREALSPQEVHGYELFTSFGCISCHQGVNVGGNLFERSGIFHPLAPGEAPVLRVPSLRNVAVTAPYFHDGSATTLNQAVQEMGYVQLDRQLSDDQVEAIVAFLGSLTGRYEGHLLTQPAP